MIYRPRHGLNVPTVSIVDDAGHIIEDQQRRVIRYVIQNGFGADVIFGNGTTGEWNRLKNDQRARLIAMTIEEVQHSGRSGKVGQDNVEAWVGVNGKTKADVLSNLDVAIQLRADAAVIAPLAIDDLNEDEIVRFFRRDVAQMIEEGKTNLPVFLYDNADINSPGRQPHVRTHVVKELSRLPWIAGIKVSAPRHVLGNYTKGALHFKQPGEFGIYIGNAMLIFDWYRPQSGFIGRLREGLNEWLLSRTLPVGVVSGPGNVLPREWHKAWRVCWAGDTELMDQYYRILQKYEDATKFSAPGGQYAGRYLACLKYALELEGVIDSSLVVKGTAPLSAEEKSIFRDRWLDLKGTINSDLPEIWRSTKGHHPQEIRKPGPMTELMDL